MMKPDTDKKTIIAAVLTPAIADTIAAYADERSDVVASVTVSETPVASASSIVNGGADVVVIEAADASAETLDSLERLCGYLLKGGSFVVIMPDASTEAVRRLFRAGVTDVLPAPIVDNELFAALNTACGKTISRAMPAAPKVERGQIVAFTKSAGGIGSTLIATNLAAECARFLKAPVAAIDLDIQFGAMRLMFDKAPRMTVLEVIKAGKRLDATLLTSTMSTHESGVMLLAGPKHVTPLEAVDAEFIKHLFNVLRGVFPLSVIEIPQAWCEWTGEVFRQSDMIVPVIEPSVRSGAGAARIQDGLIDFGVRKPDLFVIANRSDRAIATNERLQKICEIFNTKLSGRISDNPKVADECADLGKLFREHSPKSSLAQDMTTVAERLARRLGLEAPEGEKQSSRSGLGQLFGRGN